MDKNTLFPNKKFQISYNKISLIEIFPTFTKCSQDNTFKRFTKVPKQKFSQVKISKISPMFQTSSPTGTFSKNTPNMAYRTFPTNLGRNTPNRIFPTKMLKLIFKFTNSRFSQQQNFPKNHIKVSQKVSKIFPIKNKLFPMRFSYFPKNQTI